MAKPLTAAEKKKLQLWLSRFDTATKKVTKTNPDYASIITKDTRAVLSAARENGLLTNDAYQKRLAAYADTIKEASRRPVTDINLNVVKFKNPATGKESVLNRTSFIDKEGNYNWERDLNEVISERQAKAQSLGSQIKKGPSPAYTAYDDVKLVPETIIPSLASNVSGAGKGLQNLRGSLGAVWNPVKDGLMDPNGPLLKGLAYSGTGMSGATTNPNLNQAFALETAPKITPEQYGEEYFKAPIENESEAVGFQAAQLLAMGIPSAAVDLATGGLFAGVRRLGALKGIAPAAANAAEFVTGLAPGVAEVVTKNPVYNAIGNPVGASQEAINNKALREMAQGQSGQAQEMGAVSNTLLNIAGLALGTSLNTAGRIVNGGSFSEIKQGVRSVRQSIRDGLETARAVGDGGKITPLSRARIFKAGIEETPIPDMYLRPMAANAAQSAIPMGVQAGLAVAQPYDEKTKKGYEMPSATDVIDSVAQIAFSSPHKDSILGKFNNVFDTTEVGTGAILAVSQKSNELRRELQKESRLIDYLIRNSGLSYDQALAYVSQSRKEQFPDRPEIRTLQDINDMTETRRIDQGMNPSLDRVILGRVLDAGKYKRESPTQKLPPMQGPKERFSVGRAIRGAGDAITDALGPQPENETLGQFGYAPIAGRQDADLAVHDLITGPLQGFSTVTREWTAALKSRLAMQESQKKPLTKTELEKTADNQRRPLPHTSMIVTTPDGLKRIVYDDSLRRIGVTDDVTYPTNRQLTPQAITTDVNNLTPDNLRKGLPTFNDRNNIDIRWSHRGSDNKVYDYHVRGFDADGPVVTKSLSGGPGLEDSTYRVGRRELNETLPESSKEKIISQLEAINREFGGSDIGDNNGAIYSSTDFSTVDRAEFPHQVAVGGGKVIPARLINKTNEFYSYQIPTGGVIRVRKESMGSAKNTDTLMTPIDTRMERVAGIVYADNLTTQVADVKSREFIDVQLGDDVTSTRRVYINARDQDILEKMYEKHLRKQDKRLQNNEDLEVGQKKFEKDVAKFLRNMSQIEDPSDVRYNDGTETGGSKITAGDVVLVNSSTDELGAISRPARIPEGQLRAVVLGIDKDGVHIALQDRLDETAAIVHPDLLRPVHEVSGHQFQPNAERFEFVDMTNFGSSGFGIPGVLDENGQPVTAPLDTTPADATPAAPMPVDSVNPAPDLIYQRAIESTTIESAQNHLEYALGDLSVTPNTIGRVYREAFANATSEVRDNLVHAVLTFDVDRPLEINEITRLNAVLDAMISWNKDRDVAVNYTDDFVSHMSEGMTQAGRKVYANTVNTLASEALDRWRRGRLETHVRNIVSKLDLPATEKAAMEAAVVQRAVQMQHVGTTLRTRLKNIGVTANDFWASVSFMSPEQQAEVEAQLKYAEKTGTMPTSQRQFAEDFRYVASQVSPLTRVRKKYDVKAYREKVTSELEAFAAKVSGKVVEVTVAKSSDPNTSITELKHAMDMIQNDPAAMKEIISNLASQDLDAETFNKFFSDVRFPNSKLTISDIARVLKNNGIDDLTGLNNSMKQTLQNITTDVDITPQSMYNDIFTRLGDTSPAARKYLEDNETDILERLDEAYKKNPADYILQVGTEVEGFVSHMAKAATKDAIAGAAETAAAINKEYIARNTSPEKVSLAAKRFLEEAGSLPSGDGSVRQGGVRLLPQDVISQFVDMTADNAVQASNGSRVSQERLAVSRQILSDAAPWLKAFNQRSIADQVWTLPLPGAQALMGAAPPRSVVEKGINGEVRDKGVTYSTDEQGNARVGLNQQRGLNRDSMVAVIKDMLTGGQEFSNIGLNQMVDDMANTYADMWDVHAHGYAVRHMEYELKTGNSIDAKKFYSELIRSAMEAESDPGIRSAMQKVYDHVQDTGTLLVDTGTKKFSKDANSVVADAFREVNKDYGVQFGKWLSTHRMAQLVHDFYTTNAQVNMSSASVNQFSEASLIRGSYGSLTTGPVIEIPGSQRAIVNLMLHINKDKNAGRNALSVGHELFHGVYHTMPLHDKLRIAKNALAMFGDKTNNSLSSALRNVTTELSDYNKEVANLKKVIAEGTDDEVDEARKKLAELEYHYTIDMHGDTNSFLYTDPTINEVVVSYLMSTAMQDPLIYSDDSNIAHYASGAMSRLGIALNQAIGVMTRGNTVQSDWVGAETGSSHRWTLGGKSFFHVDAAGNPIATPMMSGWTLRFTDRSTRAQNVLQPLTSTPDGLAQNNIGGDADLSDVKRGPSIFGQFGGFEHIDMPFKVHRSLIFVDSKSDTFNKLRAKGIKPVATGGKNKNWFEMDVSDTGMPVNSVGGVPIRDKRPQYAYVVEADTEGGKRKRYITYGDVVAMQPNVRVSGSSGSASPTVAGILYSSYGRVSEAQQVLMGMADQRQQRILKGYAFMSGPAPGLMPDVAGTTFGVSSKEISDLNSIIKNGSPEDAQEAQDRLDEIRKAYSDSPIAKAIATSKVNSAENVLAVADTTTDAISIVYNNGLKQAIGHDDQKAQEEVRKKINNARQGMENLRTSLFGIRPADNRPIVLSSKSETSGDTTNVHISSFFGNKSGNTLSSAPIYLNKGEGTGDGDPTSYTLSRIARRLTEDFDSSDELNDIGEALVKSRSVIEFGQQLQRKGYDDTFISDALSAIESATDESMPTGVALSMDSAFTIARDFAKGSVNFISDADGDTGPSAFSQNLQDVVEGFDGDDPIPLAHNQRAIITFAVRAYAESQNRLGKAMSEADVLEAAANPFSQEYTAISAFAQALSVDISHRATALKSRGEYQLVDSIYLFRKSTPWYVLRHDVRASGSDTSGVSRNANSAVPSTYHIAVNKASGEIAFVTQKKDSNGDLKWVALKQGQGRSAYSSIDRSSRNPEKSTNFNKAGALCYNPEKELTDNVKTKYESRFKYGIAGIRAALLKIPEASAQTLLNTIDGLSKRKPGTSAVVTVSLPHRWGYDPNNPSVKQTLTPEQKFKDFDEVLKAMTGQADYDAAVLRNVKITILKDNTIEITDLGIGGNEVVGIERRLGGMKPHIGDTLPVALPEVHIAKILVHEDMEKGDDGILAGITHAANQQSPVPGRDEKFGHSVFSGGFDPQDMFSSLGVSNQTLDEAKANGPVGVIDEAMIDQQGNTEVFSDPTLSPTQLVIDADKSGIVQVRAGFKLNDAIKENSSGVITGAAKLLDELNTMTRVLALGRDIGVASNQAWLIANPMSDLMYMIKHRKVGSMAWAMSALPAMIPNTPDMNVVFRAGSDPFAQHGDTSFGDKYVHLQMARLIEQVPDLSMDRLASYGLGVEYLDHYRTYQAALQDNSNIRPEDIPLHMRMSDYYGSGEFARKIVPMQSAIERANVLYKDLAIISAFQQMYQATENVIPPAKLNMTADNYREKLRREYAEAINFMTGNDGGSPSENAKVAALQSVMAKAVISTKYAKSRLVLSPLGPVYTLGKHAINNVAETLGFDKIANTTIEDKVWLGQDKGGWSSEVKWYVTKKWLSAYLSSKATQIITRSPKILAVLAAASGGAEVKGQVWEEIYDELFLDDSGMMKVDILGTTYMQTLPGAQGRAVRQAGRASTKWRTHSIPENIEYWVKQFGLNMLAPYAATVKEAVTGRDFTGKPAFESHLGYEEYVKQLKADPNLRLYGIPDAAKNIPGYLTIEENIKKAMPDKMTRFAIDALNNVNTKDMLSDMEYMSTRNFDSGMGTELSSEDISRQNIVPFIMNFFGSGATQFDDDYQKWLRQRVGGSARYKQAEEELKSLRPQSAVDIVGESGVRGLFNPAGSGIKE